MISGERAVPWASSCAAAILLLRSAADKKGRRAPLAAAMAFCARLVWDVGGGRIPQIQEAWGEGG